MVYTFFHKNSSGSGVKIEIMSKQQLSKEIYKSIVRISEKQKVYYKVRKFRATNFRKLKNYEI